VRVVSESSKMGTYSDSEANPGSSFLWVGEQVQLNREEADRLARSIQYWLKNKRLPHDFALLEEVRPVSEVCVNTGMSGRLGPVPGVGNIGGDSPDPVDELIEDFEEDFPGQRDEMRLHDAIRKAVDAADKIILEASDGSVEETDFLTVSVTGAFVEKVVATLGSKLRKYELNRRRA
jgi:hypothetical protein